MDAQAERRERLRGALRANLKRRKAQSRARETDASVAADGPDGRREEDRRDGGEA